MYNVRKKVSDVLKEVGLPYGYVSKDEGNEQFIAYNIHSNKAYLYYDDEEQVTQYKITINIFSVYDFTEVQQKVEQLMLAAGFSKDYYPACIAIDNMDGMYNQPMFFNYFVEGE